MEQMLDQMKDPSRGANMWNFYEVGGRKLNSWKHNLEFPYQANAHIFKWREGV